MPFCQYTKESLQDKGNQQIEGEHCTLTRSELQDIFNVKEREGCMDIIEKIMLKLRKHICYPKVCRGKAIVA
jgi:hypothetical protein